MVKVLRYFNKKQKVYIGVALIFIVLQVWLDLKLPDYMSNITTLVETKGSSMTDILAQGGYMLACAIGSMIASIIVGYYAAVVAAGLAKTLRGLVFDKTMSFSMAEINRFSTASLINRTTNDITQIQTLIAMGLQAIIKAPILAVWAVIKISGNNWQWSASTAVAVFVLVIMLAVTLIFAVPRFKRIQGITDKLNPIVKDKCILCDVIKSRKPCKIRLAGLSLFYQDSSEFINLFAFGVKNGVRKQTLRRMSLWTSICFKFTQCSDCSNARNMV